MTTEACIIEQKDQLSATPSKEGQPKEDSCLPDGAGVLLSAIVGFFAWVGIIKLLAWALA